MRLLYMKANRNRMNDPATLLAVAAQAEAEGIDVSGSRTAESQAYSDRAKAEQAAADEKLIEMPQRTLQDRIRQDMMTAAAAGLPLSQFRNRAISAGARPTAFDKAAADWQRRYAPKPVQTAVDTPTNPAMTPGDAGAGQGVLEAFRNKIPGIPNPFLPWQPKTRSSALGTSY